jgi:hypothetical protein
VVPWRLGLVGLTAAILIAIAAVALKGEVPSSLGAGLERLTNGGLQVKAFLYSIINKGAPSLVEFPHVGTNAVGRVMLYEEDGTASAGQGVVGTVAWRTDNSSSGALGEYEHVVRADIEIPARHLSVRWSLRNNSDEATAPHILEMAFALPPDFIHGSIAKIPNVLMKSEESSAGTPLTGVSVKVGSNIFLVNLSADPDATQRNIQLLKDQSWIDIPILYDDGQRAIMAIEKGSSGARVYSDAFAAWNQ